MNSHRTQSGFALTNVLFIGSILCADKCQSQADFSLKTGHGLFCCTQYTHTHTPPAQKKKNLQRLVMCY